MRTCGMCFGLVGRLGVLAEIRGAIQEWEPADGAEHPRVSQRGMVSQRIGIDGHRDYVSPARLAETGNLGQNYATTGRCGVRGE